MDAPTTSNSPGSDSPGGSSITNSPACAPSHASTPDATQMINRSFDEICADKLRPRSSQSGQKKKKRKNVDISAVIITSDDFEKVLKKQEQQEKEKLEEKQKRKEEMQKKKEAN